MGEISRHSDLLDKLMNGVSALSRSDKWSEYLDYQSRFRDYSFSNVLLIALQRPGATRVAGYKAWEKLGRRVSRGEKAIYIRAPILHRRALSDDAGTESSELSVRGFRYVPVFDVAQTEGDAVPSVCENLSSSDPRDAYDRLLVVASQLGYRVEYAELPGRTNGDCSFDLRRIRIRTENSPAQHVKTLAHEIGHAMLHEETRDRRLAELEAESIAYVVCAALGLDSGRYSFGYVTIWSGGGAEAIDQIKSSCHRIQQAAGEILSSMPVSAAAHARVGGRSERARSSVDLYAVDEKWDLDLCPRVTVAVATDELTGREWGSTVRTGAL